MCAGIGGTSSLDADAARPRHGARAATRTAPAALWHEINPTVHAMDRHQLTMVTGMLRLPPGWRRLFTRRPARTLATSKAIGVSAHLKPHKSRLWSIPLLDSSYPDLRWSKTVAGARRPSRSH
jgi:hypothetical protein